MDKKISGLVAAMELNPPASEDVLAGVQAGVGVTFPPGYTEFMKESDGAVGFVGESYLHLWPLEDIVARNEALQVAEFAPGLVLFGSAGDDTAFAFDTRSQPATFVDVPMIGMSLEEATPRGRTFVEFLEVLYAGLEW